MCCKQHLHGTHPPSSCAALLYVPPLPLFLLTLPPTLVCMCTVHHPLRTRGKRLCANQDGICGTANILTWILTQMEVVAHSDWGILASRNLGTGNGQSRQSLWSAGSSSGSAGGGDCMHPHHGAPVPLPPFLCTQFVPPCLCPFL